MNEPNRPLVWCSVAPNSTKTASYGSFRYGCPVDALPTVIWIVGTNYDSVPDPIPGPERYCCQRPPLLMNGQKLTKRERPPQPPKLEEMDCRGCAVPM